jgi:hypothetical protein
MQKEIFKDVPNYEGLYQVSNLGNVKSLPKNITMPNGGIRVQPERILKPSKNCDGYYLVVLCKEGKQKTIKIHTLVAMAWLNHEPDGTTRIVPDHKNNIKTDNRAENLELLTHRQNIEKAYLNKKTSSQYTGVYWNKNRNKWHAQITIDSKMIHLGSFNEEYESHLAYQKALKMYNDGDLSFIKIRKKSSKYIGVSYKKNAKKWRSRITINGKQKYLGLFQTEEQAHEAVQKALKELNK